MMEKPAERDALPDVAQLKREVADVVKTTPVIDIHTHLLAPEFGDMSLFGIDELLTYHYLIVETLRSSEVTAEQFWRMTRTGGPGMADSVRRKHALVRSDTRCRYVA